MSSDEQAIRDLIDTWMRASAAGDVATIASLLDEDVVFLTPGHEPMRGRDAFLAAQRSVLQQVHISGSSEVREVQVAGGWGWCWTHLDVTITPHAGAPNRRTGYTLSVFRRQADGRWTLYRDANLLAAHS